MSRIIPPNYMVIRSDTISELEETVTYWLKDNWKCAGGVSQLGSDYYQALYKDKVIVMN